MKIGFSIVILTMMISGIFGQSIPIKCGFDLTEESSLRLSEIELKEYQDFRSKLFGKSLSEELDTVFVQLHIIRNDDGSDIVDPDDIEEGIGRARSFFMNAGIIFEYCGNTRYVDSSADQDYRSGENHILTDSINPNALNIYYFANTFTADGETRVCGFGGSTGVFMGCPKGNTLAHEIGHHYGLAHTHGRYNFEPPDYAALDPMINGFPTPVYYEGAARYFGRALDDNNNGIFDCLETGDGVCDTPAEPVRLGDAYDFFQCTYSGEFRDYFGDLYEPRPGNVMSYGACQEEHFSDEQYSLMKFNLRKNFLNELCQKCASSPQEEWVVTTTDDFGIGSLRSIVACNNKKNGPIRITFDIPEEEGDSIFLELPLGTIVATEVEIDGFNKRSGNNMLIVTPGIFLETDKITLSNISMKGRDQNFVYPLIFDGLSAFHISNTHLFNFQRAIWPAPIDSLIIESSIIGHEENDLRNQSSIATVGTLSYLKIGGEVEEGNILYGNDSNSTLSIGDVESGELSNNRFINSPQAAVFLNSSEQFEIAFNHFKGIRTAALDITTCFQTTLFDNTFEANTVGTMIFIDSIFDSEIIDNNIVQSRGRGIQSVYADSVLISNNIIRRTASTGMQIGEVINCSIVENQFDSTSSSAIDFSILDFSEIADNQFRTSLSNSMLNIDTLIDSEIVNNTISNAASRALNARYGEDVLIADNDIITSENSGIFFGRLEQAEISGNILEDTRISSIDIIESVTVTIEENSISETRANGFFGGDGISLDRGENVQISNNEIFNNEGSGILISDFISTTFIGDKSDESTNLIYGNARYGLRILQSSDVLIGVNYIECNDQGTVQYSRSEVITPTVTRVEPTIIEGFTDADAEVHIYVNNDSCSVCDMELLLTTINADQAGIWSFNPVEFDLEFGTMINAISNSGNRSSALSQCTPVEVPVGCEIEIDSFPFMNDFSNFEIEEAFILGNGFSIFDTVTCPDSDTSMLFFDARNGFIQNISLLYRRIQSNRGRLCQL